jgi:hypothetical protein
MIGVLGVCLVIMYDRGRLGGGKESSSTRCNLPTYVTLSRHRTKYQSMLFDMIHMKSNAIPTF